MNTDEIICRKRRRNDSEDCEDCLPISKRINKLHIESARRSQEEGLVNSDLNQVFNGEGCSTGNCDNQLQPWQQAQIANHSQVCGPVVSQACVSGASHNQVCVPGPSNYQAPSLDTQTESTNNNVLLHGPQSTMEAAHGQLNMDDIQGYDPELKKEENPYYFQVNHVLYDAHVLRVTRTKSFQSLNS